MAEVKVMHTWVSAFGMRVLIALHEKGVPYEFEEVDLFNRSETFLKANPIYNKVPVFIHNRKTLPESAIILQYIDEIWPGKSSYMPSDPYERAQARFWTAFIDKQFAESAITLIVRGTGEKQEEGKKKLLEYLGLLEGALGEKAYFGGEEFGFLDIALISFWPGLGAYEIVGQWKIPLETEFCKLNEWAKRCMQRDSVKTVLPDTNKIVEFAFEVREKFPLY